MCAEKRCAYDGEPQRHYTPSELPVTSTTQHLPSIPVCCIPSLPFITDTLSSGPPTTSRRGSVYSLGGGGGGAGVGASNTTAVPLLSTTEKLQAVQVEVAVLRSNWVELRKACAQRLREMGIPPPTHPPTHPHPTRTHPPSLLPLSFCLFPLSFALGRSSSVYHGEAAGRTRGGGGAKK